MDHLQSKEDTHKTATIEPQNVLDPENVSPSKFSNHSNNSSQGHHKKFKHKYRAYHSRQGGHVQLPLENIIKYLQKFTTIMKNTKHITKLFSIQNFRKDVHSNTVLRMYFQGALDSIPKTVSSADEPGKERPGVLYSMSIDQVLDLINVVAQTPPSVAHSEYSGLPIYVLLIDLINTDLGRSLFSQTQVSFHLKNIFNDYGNMLKSAKSLEFVDEGIDGWLSKQACEIVNYADYICNVHEPHFGFKSWNDWFTRQLVPGARPVGGEGDPLVIVHAAENYPLTTLQLPFKNVKAIDKFWLKQNRYSLYDMFQAEKMGTKHIINEAFVGGTVYQGFLSPWCYHWWHSPVDGYIEKSYYVPGNYFMQSPDLDLSGIDNYIDSQSFLSCVSSRHVYIIQTGDPRVGRVGVIEIGMVQVSACISIVNVGDHVKKGQPIGHFEFGGSSHVVVFDKRVCLDFNPKIYDREEKTGLKKSIMQPINSWLAKVIPKQDE